jgi:hypothetical protein
MDREREQENERVSEQGRQSRHGQRFRGRGCRTRSRREAHKKEGKGGDTLDSDLPMILLYQRGNLLNTS